MARMILTGGRVIDPAQNIDKQADVLMEDGRIVGITDVGRSDRQRRNH